MSITEYIGIESFNYFHDNRIKKMIINRIFKSEDLSNIVKDYLFISLQEKKVRELKVNICYTINKAYVCTRRMEDVSGRWAFCESMYYMPQFQALNCICCGDYINTRSIDTDEHCPDNIRCGCVYMHLGGGVYFNWTYNRVV